MVSEGEGKYEAARQSPADLRQSWGFAGGEKREIQECNFAIANREYEYLVCTLC